MNAWSFDANQIKEAGQFDTFYLVQNQLVNEFIEIRPHESKFFIVAAKGIGKTLLLKYKSAKYRQSMPGTLCVPEGELCERLTPAGAEISLAQEDLSSFSTSNHWLNIWLLCLMCVVLKRTQALLPEELEDLFQEANNVNDILNIIFRSRRNIYNYIKYIATHLAPAVEKVRKPVVIFIDNVDEAMDRHVGAKLRDSLQTHGKPLGAVSEKVWINAQLGLIEAAKAINARNAGIKIFAAIRLEAFTSDSSSTYIQNKDLCTILKYSDDDLKNIFEANIRLMKADGLVKPFSQDLVERFFGFKEIPHAHVKNADGSQAAEEIFKYVLRHTLRRPRELLFMGKEISQIPAQNRDEDAVRQTVNKISTEILFQYKKEIVPFWDEAENVVLLTHVRNKIITSSKAQTFERKYPGILATFYRRGLLGVVKPKHFGDGLIQAFLPAAEHLFDFNETLPQSSHYLLHPCVEEELRRKHGTKYLVERHNIIGYDYPFSIGKVVTKRWNHVHFGAGKLGLGMIPNIFHGRSSLCILQRYSNKWENILKSDLQNSGMLNVRLQVCGLKLDFLAGRDPISETSIKKLLAFWLHGRHILIISNDTSILARFASEANSYSTALKDGLSWAEDILLKISHRKSQNIYCFENLHEDIEKFAHNLQNEKYLQVVPVVADRICRNVKINNNKKSEAGITIDVECEQHCYAYVENKNGNVSHFFRDCPLVKVAKDRKHFLFYYQRKFYLMNGIHAVMAFNHYAALARRNVSIEDWKRQILIDANGECVDVITYVQICRVIAQNQSAIRDIYPGKSIPEIFNMLFAYSKEIIKRIEHAPDEIGRILPANAISFDDKFRQRCEEIVKFVENNWPQVELWNIPDLPTQTDILCRLSEFERDVINVVITAMKQSELRTHMRS